MRFHRAPASAARLLTCGAHAGRPVPADRILREFDGNQKHWYQNKIPQSISSDATTAVLKINIPKTRPIVSSRIQKVVRYGSKYVQEYVLQSLWANSKFIVCGVVWIRLCTCLAFGLSLSDIVPVLFEACPGCLNKVKHGMDHQMKALQKS